MSNTTDQVSLKDYVEQQIADVRRAVEVALAAAQDEGIPLRDLLDALMAERDRALREGDARLLDHITNQISQIRDALVAAEKLETSRVALVEERIQATERLLATVSESALKAQEKFEVTVTARFAQVNEFRGSLDDLGKTMATRRELEAAVAASAALLAELQKQMVELRSLLVQQRSEFVALDTYQTRHEALRNEIAATRDEARHGIDVLRNESRTSAEVTRAAAQEAVKQIREEQVRGGGRRTALVAAGGLMTALVLALLGLSLKGGLTPSDVEQQVKQISPWFDDKPQVERELTDLQSKLTGQQIKLATLQQRLELVCRSRTNLAGC